MSDDISKPNIILYKDYRLYLRDWFTWKRSQGHYTYRDFSAEMSFSSPNQLLLIIQGKRNVSEKNCDNYARILELGSREKKYFEILVHFNQAKFFEDKKKWLEEITPYWIEKAKHISSDENEYLARWYVSAIREMVALKNFRDDAQWISKKLNRLITPHQAQEAWDLLLRLGFVKNEDDKWISTDDYITTGPEVADVHAIEYHEFMIEEARKSVRADSDRRHVSSLCFTVDREYYLRFVDEIGKFRKKIIDELSARVEKNQDQDLYQLNFQFFPLTKEKL